MHPATMTKRHLRTILFHYCTRPSQRSAPAPPRLGFKTASSSHCDEWGGQITCFHSSLPGYTARGRLRNNRRQRHPSVPSVSWYCQGASSWRTGATCGLMTGLWQQRGNTGNSSAPGVPGIPRRRRARDGRVVAGVVPATPSVLTSPERHPPPPTPRQAVARK